ncbi:MAG: iron uptake protein [Pseudomonadota bacterium]|nr:iron uptake protein [Pseudomonadota bacterium]
MKQVLQISKQSILPVVIAICGSYALAWGIVCLGIPLAVMLGLGFHDAEAAMNMLVFPLCLIVFLWAFAQQSKKLWAGVYSIAFVFILIGWSLQQILLG